MSVFATLGSTSLEFGLTAALQRRDHIEDFVSKWEATMDIEIGKPHLVRAFKSFGILPTLAYLREGDFKLIWFGWLWWMWEIHFETKSSTT